MSASPTHRTDRTWLIALAASLWGLSAIWRDPLARQYPSVAVVFWEHVVLVLLVSPWLVSATRSVARASRRTQVSVLVIGAGSSALATILFTSAFRLGDPITPQVLQKLQPLIALLLAALLLGERLRPSFAFFAVPALAGAWLLSFPEPFAIGITGLYAAGLALAGTLTAAKVGSRRVQSRTAAGGWSQQRFARRRGKQADELVDAVVRHARRILLRDDESPARDVDGLPRGMVVGGDRLLVGEVLEAPALRALRGLPMRELYDLPDPRRDVLETALRRGRAYRISLNEP